MRIVTGVLFSTQHLLTCHSVKPPLLHQQEDKTLIYTYKLYTSQLVDGFKTSIFPSLCVHPCSSYPAGAAWPPEQPSLRRPAGFCRSSCSAPAPPCRPCSEYIPSSWSPNKYKIAADSDGTWKLRPQRHARGYGASIQWGGGSLSLPSARGSNTPKRRSLFLRFKREYFSVGSKTATFTTAVCFVHATTFDPVELCRVFHGEPTEEQNVVTDS